MEDKIIREFIRENASHCYAKVESNSRSNNVVTHADEFATQDSMDKAVWMAVYGQEAANRELKNRDLLKQ